MSAQPAPRVVAAVSADVRARLRAVLGGCELVFVQSGTELVLALDRARCDLLVVEVHFDQSTAEAALRCVLSREESFPVVCVRDVPLATLRHAVLNALRSALDRAVVDDFIDLAEHVDDAAGNARVRTMFGRHLALGAVSPGNELASGLSITDAEATRAPLATASAA